MDNLTLRPRHSSGWVTKLPSKDAVASTRNYTETIDLSVGGSESGNLTDYWRIARRHKALLCFLAVVGAIAGFMLGSLKTPVYQARALVEIQNINEDFLKLRDLNPNDPNTPNFPEVDLQTHVKRFQSRTLIEQVVAALNVDDRPSLTIRNNRLPDWKRALRLNPTSPVPLQDTLVSAAAEDLKVRVEPNTRIIEIRYDSVDPKFAADFTNTLVSEFVEESLQARWRTSQYTSEWLGRQMQGLKAKLQASEQQLQDYVRSSGLQFTAEKENVAEEKLRQLQLELSKAQADRLARQSRFELASSVPTDALPEVLDDMTLRQYQISVTDLRRQVVELSASLTPTNPKITRLQAQIALLEGAIEKERSNITRRIRNEYETSRRREALLRADFESQSSLLTDQASRVAHYGIMKREVESSRELYESMLRRVREATVASALRASNIWVVEPAKPPDKPYKPNTTLNSALGLISGLFGGFILVLMRERADQRIKAPGDTWANLNVSELGTIPICESKLLHRPHRGASKSIGSGKDARVLGLSATSGEAAEQEIACRVELITHHDRLSIVSECFRNVLTSIMLSSPNGERPRTLVLTSAIPGDGKTMVTSNLAIALAETNLKVLLIDGDLRKPHLHQIFEVDNCAGFSDFLKELPKSPLASLVTATVIPGLSILPSGSERDPDLVHSTNLPELLRRIRAEFDIVLIDTPPTLLFPDARILARNADAVILVLRAGQTTWSTARSLCRRLSEDNTPILGAILNEWNPKATGAYSDGKYYRYYGRYYSKT